MIPALRPLLAFAATLALAACGDRAAEQPPAPAPQETADETGPARQAAEEPAAAPDLRYSLKEETGAVSVEIATPQDVLSRDPALHARIFGQAEAQAEAFMASAAEAEAEAAAADYPYNPYQLSIDWSAPFDNGEIASLVGLNWQYTGGAHGNSYFETLTWSFADSAPIAVSDLFADTPETWNGLSRIAKEKLLQAKRERMSGYTDGEPEDPGSMWMDAIKDATAPEVSSFDLMTLVPSTQDGKAGGIKLYYPPYAVGPYAEGSYEIVLPQADIAQYIAPAYRDLFAGGPAPDPQLNQGGEE